MLNQEILSQHLQMFIQGNTISSTEINEEFLLDFTASYFRVLAQETFLNETPEFTFIELLQEFPTFLSTYEGINVESVIKESLQEYFVTLSQLV